MNLLRYLKTLILRYQKIPYIAERHSRLFYLDDIPICFFPYPKMIVIYIFRPNPKLDFYTYINNNGVDLDVCHNYEVKRMSIINDEQFSYMFSELWPNENIEKIKEELANIISEWEIELI